MTTKQSIHEDFSNIFVGKHPSRALVVATAGIVDFYDTKIQQLLQEIVPKEIDYKKYEEKYPWEAAEYKGMNRAITIIKENIHKAGF